jgi:chloramphenicol 3-O-phosphotransferase
MIEPLIFFAAMVSSVGIIALLDWIAERRDRRPHRQAGFVTGSRKR